MSEAESKAFTGKGGKFEISVDGGTTYVEVMQVTKVTQSPEKMGLADITSLSSPGRRREKIATIIDDSTWSLDIIANQQDPGQLLFASSFAAGLPIDVKITYPKQPGMNTGLVREFSAYISSNGMAGLDIADASRFTAELTVTGDYTDTPGA